LHQHLPHLAGRPVRGHHHLGDGRAARLRVHAGQPGLQLVLQHRLLDHPGLRGRVRDRQAGRAPDRADGHQPGRDPVDGEASDPTDAEHMRAKLSPAENRGLLVAVLSTAVLTAAFLYAVLIPDSPWRNEDGGFLPTSPLLSSIVFIVVAYFVVVGIAYGAAVGTLRSSRDAVRMMSDAIKEMLPFVVLAFILGNFIALFNWSGIGTWIAVT